MRHRTCPAGLCLTLLVLSAAGSSVGGCASDDNPDVTGTESDAGGSARADAEGGTGPGDASASSDVTLGSGAEGGSTGADSGSGADGAASVDAGIPPLFALVHAAPDVPPVRFCFGVSPAGALAGVAAKPALATGLPFGAGGALTVASSQAAALSGTDLYLWAIPAASINGASDAGQDPADCGSAFNLQGSILFSKIPKGTFLFNHSYIVAMDGCETPAVDGGAAVCGPALADAGSATFPGGSVLGNLRLEIVDVDRSTPVPPAAFGAQFLHLSPSLQALLPAGVVPAIASPADAGASEDGGDASASVPAYDYADLTAEPVRYNAAYAGPPGSTVAEPPQAFTGTAAAAMDFETAGIGLLTAALTVPVPSLASISLGAVATATLGPIDGGPRSASDLFVTGQSYTFVALGNVGETPGTSATFFRVIALPAVH